ncbi:hypothetical protein D3C76_1228010 [compost metagenome]
MFLAIQIENLLMCHPRLCPASRLKVPFRVLIQDDTNDFGIPITNRDSVIVLIGLTHTSGCSLTEDFLRLFLTHSIRNLILTVGLRHSQILF